MSELKISKLWYLCCNIKCDTNIQVHKVLATNILYDGEMCHMPLIIDKHYTVTCFKVLKDKVVISVILNENTRKKLKKGKW